MARADSHSDSECWGLLASNPRVRGPILVTLKVWSEDHQWAARLTHEGLSLGGACAALMQNMNMSVFWCLAQIHNFELQCKPDVPATLVSLWKQCRSSHSS